MELVDFIPFVISAFLIIGAVFYVFEDHFNTMKSHKIHKEEIATRTTQFMLLGKEVSIEHRANYDPHFVRELETEVRENGALTTCGKDDCTTCHDSFLCVDDQCKICNPPTSEVKTPNEKREEFDYANITVDELLGINIAQDMGRSFYERALEQCRSAFRVIREKYEVQPKNVTADIAASPDGMSYILTFKFHHPKTGEQMYMKGVVLTDDMSRFIPSAKSVREPVPSKSVDIEHPRHDYASHYNQARKDELMRRNREYHRKQEWDGYFGPH